MNRHDSVRKAHRKAKERHAAKEPKTLASFSRHLRSITAERLEPDVLTWPPAAARPENHLVDEIIREIKFLSLRAASGRRWPAVLWQARFAAAVTSVMGSIIEAVNPRFARLHGFAIHELVGRPYTDLLPDEALAEVADELSNADENENHEFDVVHIGRFGRTIPVHVTVHAIHRWDGAPGQRLIVVQPSNAAEFVRAESAGAKATDSGSLVELVW